jgi:hypothetical protein
MRARPLYRFAVLSSAFALSATLGACLGGTGTDTENGISVVDGSSRPMANVRIYVRPATATPDSAGADPVVNGSGTPVTDEKGFVRFHMDREGSYLVEGRRGDTVLFVDTLRASHDKPQVIVARTPVRLSGRIRLLSGLKTDTGLVFVRGTGLSATVRSDGTYDLGWGPADALELTVGLRYETAPALRAAVKMSARYHAGKILNALDWTQPPTEQLVLARDSMTLYKAAQSANPVLCLENASVSVAPAYSVVGSINEPLDVIRETGVACGGHAGTLIETYAVNSAGQSTGKLGDFLMPDSIAWGEGRLGRPGSPGTDYPASQQAILASCVRSASQGVTYRTTVKEGGEVRVEDLLRGINCLAEQPPEP